SVLNCAVLLELTSACNATKSAPVFAMSVPRVAVLVELLIAVITAFMYPSRYALLQVIDENCTCNCCSAYFDLGLGSANAAEGNTNITHAINAVYWSLVCMRNNSL